MLQHIYILLANQLLWANFASSPLCLLGLVLTGVCGVSGGQGHNFTFCYSSFPLPVSSYGGNRSSALQLFMKTHARLEEDSSQIFIL